MHCPAVVYPIREYRLRCRSSISVRNSHLPDLRITHCTNYLHVTEYGDPKMYNFIDMLMTDIICIQLTAWHRFEMNRHMMQFALRPCRFDVWWPRRHGCSSKMEPVSGNTGTGRCQTLECGSDGGQRLHKCTQCKAQRAPFYVKY